MFSGHTVNEVGRQDSAQQSVRCQDESALLLDTLILKMIEQCNKIEYVPW